MPQSISKVLFPNTPKHLRGRLLRGALFILSVVLFVCAGVAYTLLAIYNESKY